MSTQNDNFNSIIQDIDLGNINEAKKMALLDDIGTILTHRILIRLVDSTPAEKKSVFIEKINENKSDPDKILLFIDHFVENADDVVDNEIAKCKEDIQNIIQTTTHE